jgi:glycosyltransferase involved in cell wall biosynthesis
MPHRHDGSFLSTTAFDTPGARMTSTSRRVWWTGPLSDASGYATEGRLLVSGLTSLGVIVCAESPPPWLLPQIVAEAVEPGMADHTAWDVRPPRPPDAQVLHLPWAEPFPRQPQCRGIWRTMFETDSLPATWVQRSREVDEIWVPSRWNVETFTAGGVDPRKIRVLHQPLDTGLFAPVDWGKRSSSVFGEGTFVFLSVFTWQYRKGWDVLLRAYFKEFTTEDNVVLVLRVDPFPFGGDDSPVRDRIEAFRVDTVGSAAPAVHLIETQLPARDLPSLYASAGAFVLPSRGEAWGRPMFEAIAMGTPVVATGWGGQMEYLLDGSGIAIDYALSPVGDAAAHEYPLFSGHRWAEPDERHLRTIMRALVDGDLVFDVDQRRVASTRVRSLYDFRRVSQQVVNYLANPL